MHWETRKYVWFALLQYLLLCTCLELNPQYLQCMLVISFEQQVYFETILKFLLFNSIMNHYEPIFQLQQFSTYDQSFFICNIPPIHLLLDFLKQFSDILSINIIILKDKEYFFKKYSHSTIFYTSQHLPFLSHIIIFF